MLKNCTRCNALFADSRSTICPACVDSEKEIVEQIETYIRTHRGVSTFEIVRDTGVDFNMLMSMIKDGRLRTPGIG